MKEQEYSLTGFNLYKNINSTFSLVLWSCQDYPTIKEIEKIDQISLTKKYLRM